MTPSVTGRPRDAAVEAGDGLEVDGGPVAQERDEPGGVLGLEGADGLERAVGPEGVGVERVRDDEAGAVRDGELVVERERFDGVLVGGLTPTSLVGTAISRRPWRSEKATAPRAFRVTYSAGSVSGGEDVVGPAGGLVREGIGDGESWGAEDLGGQAERVRAVRHGERGMSPPAVGASGRWQT